MSKLYFRYGAMNSGKSTHLMQVAHNYEERGMHIVILKPDVDKKGGNKVVSRLGVDREIAVTKDIPVICYGLRTDFKMNGFEGSERLLLLAHSIEEMKTICKCGRKAILNARMINGNFIFEGEQVAIDMLDNIEYEALCGQCYFKYKLQS